MNRCPTLLFFVVVACATIVAPCTAPAAEAKECPFEWLIGQWRFTDTTGEASTVVFDRIDDNAMRGTWTGDDGATATEVAGWHAATGKIVITGFESDGSYWHIDGSDSSKTGFSGPSVFGKSDGTQTRGVFEFTRKNGDLAVTHFVGKDTEGNDVTVDGRFERSDTTSTLADFHELVDLMVGRWSGEVTLIADWPGFKKKKGDKLVMYQTRRKVAGGEGFITTAVGGETVKYDLGFYDSVSQQISIAGTDSVGGSFRAIIRKKTSNEWPWTTKGALPDGSKIAGRGVLVVSEGGKTLTFKGTIDVEGQETSPLHDVYKRLDQ